MLQKSNFNGKMFKVKMPMIDLSIGGINKMKLVGKVAIVTGASSGIGRETARLFSEEGAMLVLHGRRKERLAELAAELGNCVYLFGDITEACVPAQLLTKALNEFGRVDIVVNNAGVNHVGTIEEIDIEKLCEMARINVEANYRLIYSVLKHFKATGNGQLINTTSVMGAKVRPTAGGYAGTKHAIEALSEALRIELAGTPIRVSCIAPGLVLTELHRDSEQHPAKSRGIGQPLEPRDVAQIALMIAVLPSRINIPQILLLPQDHAI